MLRKMIPDEIIKYIDTHWKPNQDDNYIILEKGSKDFELLSNAFEYFFNLTPIEQDENAFNVGPFIKIRPYGIFDIEERPNDKEFLFEYEDIDRSKLTQQHLMI